LHIPLAIVDPRTTSPHHDKALVSGIDLAPTLYELLGVAPPEHMEGRSLAGALRGERVTSRPLFAETELLLGMNPGLPESLTFPALGLNHLMELDIEHDSRIVVRKDAFDHTLLVRHRMVRDERWKLIYMPTPKGVVYKLFDLASDPEELVDVAAKYPDEAERLRTVLWSWMLEDPLMTRDGEFLVPKGTHAPAK
jgi:arylsulfatase A-like enzyme